MPAAAKQFCASVFGMPLVTVGRFEHRGAPGQIESSVQLYFLLCSCSLSCASQVHVVAPCFLGLLRAQLVA
jgi:hypothetical protein